MGNCVEVLLYTCVYYMCVYTRMHYKVKYKEVIRMCFAMETVRFIIIILATKNSANGMQLTSSSERATVGVDFTFTCDTDINALKFTRDSIGECTITGRYPNGTCKFFGSYNASYKYDCSTNTDIYKLTIPSKFDIDTLHGSKWACTPALDPGKSNIIQLYVNVPITKVTITTSPTDINQVSIVVDTNHKFICKTNAGRPSSRIQWYMSGTNITNTAISKPDDCKDMCNGKVISTSELLYTGNKLDDGKTIYCTAVNVEGEIVRSENKSIAIWYGPSNVSISPSKQMYTAIETTGSVGPITCIFGDCKPACSVKWNGPNLSDYSLSVLNLNKINRNQAGNYFCTASNDAWSRTSVNISVIVNYGPILVTISPSSQNYILIEMAESVGPIYCTADCKPACTVIWSGPNVPGGTTTALNLKNINRNQAGKYQCKATNIIGSHTSVEVDITVNYGPGQSIIVPNTLMYTVTEITGNVGPITCTADCKPACNITWNGPHIPAGTMSVLTISNIQRNQAGAYTCTATNGHGSKTSSTITVNVNYGPYQVNISPATLNYSVAEIDENVGPIQCTADCKPECIMTWHGPNIPDDTTSVLNFQNINRNKDGKYQCTAANVIGSRTSDMVTIIVNYGPGEVKITPNIYIYTETETTGNVGPINCSADCKPKCTMTWNGPNIQVGTISVLTLKEIDRNQAGNYTCTATNSYGTRTSNTVSVIVNYGPREFIEFPSNLSYTAIEGKGTVGPIICKAQCKPECTMSWNGPNLQDGMSSVLHLHNISKFQAGDYFCHASNYVGRLTSDLVNVIVFYGPVVVNIFPQTQNYTVNETESLTGIVCTAECKPNCTMTWIGPYFQAKFPVRSSPVLNIHNMTRNQSGKYQCRAANNVGSLVSFSIKITVNFKPAVKDIFGNSSFSENDTVVLSCNVESVPNANIKWSFRNKIIEQTNTVLVTDILQKNENDQINNLNISRIGCLAMGTYSCTAFNIIGVDTKDIDIDVRCSPRRNAIEFNVTTLIAVKDQEPLNITAPIIAYPSPDIYWIFFNNETSVNRVNVTHKSSNIVHKNRVFSSLYIQNVTEADFGHYRIYAVNGIESTEDYIYSFKVIPKRKPNPPDNVTCTGGPNYVLVNWKSNFDGGDIQSFQIFFKKDGSANFYDYGSSYKDPGRHLYRNAAVNQLKPDTTYHFSVHASNKHNVSMSEQITCNTTSAVLNDQQQTDTVAIGAGTGIGGAIVVLVIAAVVFVYIRRRRVDEKIGQDKEPMQRSVDNEDDIDDGLKENPLYVSSQQEAEGAVYSVVDKNRQNVNKNKGKLTDDNSVYTQVVKTNKKDKKSKEIEMGCVYQNSKDVTQGQNDEVYANSGIISNIENKQVYTSTKNKDGLIYADLDLAPTMGGNRFIIRGLENRNNYAVIDLTKTAEPLPSDSDSDDDKKTKKEG